MKTVKGFAKMLGFIYLKIIGFSLLIGGFHEEIIWAMIVGFLVIDITPSFIKTVWKDAEDTHSIKSANNTHHSKESGVGEVEKNAPDSPSKQNNSQVEA